MSLLFIVPSLCRRFYKDLPQIALTKPENFKILEYVLNTCKLQLIIVHIFCRRDIGLSRFFKKSLLHTFKVDNRIQNFGGRRLYKMILVLKNIPVQLLPTKSKKPFAIILSAYLAKNLTHQNFVLYSISCCKNIMPQN